MSLRSRFDVVIEPDIYNMNLSKIGAFAALCLSSSSAFASGTPDVGFQSTLLPYPTQSSVRSLSNGDVITFDGTSVDRFDASGSWLLNLATFPAPVFGGAFAIDPTETFCVLGESSNGDVFRIDLTVGGKTLLANLTFNFDADFAPDGTLVVSAATGGFGFDNDLVRLDTSTGATTFLAHVPGASGPVEFDNFGNLYYATSSASFPTPAGSTDILIFLAADLASADCNVAGGCLGDSDAVLFASGYDGATDLTLDSQTGRLYLAENNFGTGASRIWAVAGGPAGGTLPFVEESLFNWTTGLEVFGGSTAATLQAFQPAAGAHLNYTTTDYFATFERVSVTSKRASLGISGAGLSGAGSVNLAVADGQPGGGLLFFYGATGLVSQNEVSYSFGAVAPLFTSLDLVTIGVFGGILPLDGAGSTTFSFQNPGGFEGLLSIQGLLFDANYGLMLGTTNSVNF